MPSPEVLSALVSGAVSLVIALISGLYFVRRSSKRIDELKAELLAQKKTERIVAASSAYRAQFRRFEAASNQVLARNSEDGTELLQHILNFYASAARDFYLENRSFLLSEELEKLLREISATIDGGQLNSLPQPLRSRVLRELGDTIIKFSKRLHELALGY